MYRETLEDFVKTILNGVSEMSTFGTDWFIAMMLYLAFAIANKIIGSDLSATHSMIMGISIIVVYRLSKIYDLLKQRQCCKRE